MGALNDAVQAIWTAGYRISRPFAIRARQTAPERVPSETPVIVVPPQLGGVRVTEHSALQIAAVWACLNVISKAIAASAWTVFDEDDNGDRRMLRRHAVHRLLNARPNPEMNAFNFRRAILIQALLWSNGYAEIERDMVGRPIALWPLNPERVDPLRDEFGRLFYRYWNPAGGSVDLAARDVFHISGPGIDGLLGFDLTRLAAITFGHALGAERYSTAFFGNGAHAGLVVSSDVPIPPDKVQEIREAIEKQVKGPSRAHGMLVLSQMKLTHIGIEPEKAQLIETRHQIVEEIARWFDVPPHKIQHLLRATFNNIEEQGLQFAHETLAPWAEQLRQEADSKLFGGANRSIRTRIDLDWLVEGKARDQAEADAIYVRDGIKTRNEVRRRLGLNAHPDGNSLTVQQQNVPLGTTPSEPEPEPASDPAETHAALRNGSGGVSNGANGHA